MTTIAYRDGIMAADSGCIGAGSTLIGQVAKIHLIHGHLIGFAGRIAHGMALVKWLEETLPSNPAPACPPQTLKGSDKDVELTALLITSDRQVWRFKGFNEPYQLTADFYAVGSGADLALGAMAHGATADEAVAIAIRLDALSSGTVQTLSLAR